MEVTNSRTDAYSLATNEVDYTHNFSTVPISISLRYVAGSGIDSNLACEIV